MKYLPLLMTLLFISFQSLAQEAASQEENKAEKYAELMTEKLRTELELTEEQAGQMQEVLLDRYEDLGEIREAAKNGEREGIRDQSISIMQESDDRIREILSEEQWDQYESKRAAFRERRTDRE